MLSDHGEAFGDHGFFGHGIPCYQEAVHVPLIVKPPAGVERLPVIETAVPLIDVSQILARAGGARFPDGVQSRTISLNREPPPVDILTGSHIWGDPRFAVVRADRMAFHSRYRYSFGEKKGERGKELYDLSVDPGESDNLADKRPEDVDSIRGAAVDLINRLSREKAPTAPMSESMRRRLRALGYLE